MFKIEWTNTKTGEKGVWVDDDFNELGFNTREEAQKEMDKYNIFMDYSRNNYEIVEIE